MANLTIMTLILLLFTLPALVLICACIRAGVADRKDEQADYFNFQRVE